MRKLLLLLLMIIPFIGFNQLSISTDQKTMNVFDEKSNTWIPTSSKEEYTLFKFNKEMTMFVHTTSEITSAYFIDSFIEDYENYSYIL